ncbi:MAG: hypothetical protein U0169_23230 [Polyangiaceae bacterium]
MASFFTPEAKARAEAAVRAFESHTSAELVIALRTTSSRYLHAHFGWGSLFAFAGLMVLLFHPEPFSVEMIPVDLVVAYAVGAGLSVALPVLRRMFVLPGRRKSETAKAARALFVDNGITKTTGRTGVLVYLSHFEQRVEVVCDVGVTPDAKRAAETARTHLLQAFVQGDVDRFASELELLGKTFGATMPRSADDVNELSDEVA